jgi:hypothetical protein
VSLTAAVIRKMADMGLSVEQIVDLAETIEAGFAQPVAQLSAGALRTRKYRAKKESVTESVTVTRHSDVTPTPSVSPEPPSTTSQDTPPLVPLKGDSFPPAFDRAWKAYPEAGRKRSSTKLSKPEWTRATKAAGGEAALHGAIERFAESPEAREAGGKYVKGFHRWLRDGLFEPWLAPVADPDKPPDPPDDPWPRRLREFRRNGFWNTTDWGPKPGKPGYRGPELQEAA